MVKPLPRLRLQGFNNLTKALSFNIYDICYAVSEEQRQRYIEYIDEQYDSDRLTQILTDVAEIIGANILNIARQDYDPQGASVTILISEQPIVEKLGHDIISDAVVAHLDKSHITVHTYPETHPHNGIATFRADIDVATCGVISPLKALNYLIDSFESDIVIDGLPRARLHARREGQEALTSITASTRSRNTWPSTSARSTRCST